MECTTPPSPPARLPRTLTSRWYFVRAPRCYGAVSVGWAASRLRHLTYENPGTVTGNWAASRLRHLTRIRELFLGIGQGEHQVSGFRKIVQIKVVRVPVLHQLLIPGGATKPSYEVSDTYIRIRIPYGHSFFFSLTRILNMR